MLLAEVCQGWAVNTGISQAPNHLQKLVCYPVAVIWAVGGLESARAFFQRLELPFDEKFNEWDANPKGFLQMKAQALTPPRKPSYKVKKIEGSAHEPIVTVEVSVPTLGTVEATAISKSAAEVAAAAALLAKLQERNDSSEHED